MRYLVPSQAIQRDVIKATPQKDLGLCLFTIGNIRDATVHFQKTVAIDKTFVMDYDNLINVTMTGISPEGARSGCNGAFDTLLRHRIWLTLRMPLVTSWRDQTGAWRSERRGCLAFL